MTAPLSLADLRQRYQDYRGAVLFLRQNYTTVSERKKAISIRDQFEGDVREGMLDTLFDESENWG